MLSDTIGRDWFDAHLDLAYLGECGRDLAAPLNPSMEPHPPASVTLASLGEGGVRACLGTIFTEATDAGQRAKYPTTAYPAGDAEAAHEAGLRQLAHYQRWCERGLIGLMPRHGQASDRSPAPLEVGVLMECADPIREPGELGWWIERGLVAIGLSWWKSSRYAAGNGAKGGLTGLGRELIREMDRLGVVLDLSHLNQQATEEALGATDSTVIASHSNVRSLIDGVNERHLADETIVEIGRRCGVIGLNLCAPFLVKGGGDDTPATVEDCVAHIEHICEVQGSRAGVGLGSDMDGGFSAERLPVGIDRPSDLHLLSEALAQRGWSDDEVAGFRSGNWRRFWTAER